MTYKDYLDIWKSRKNYTVLFDYYKGDHRKILAKPKKGSLPDNKLVNAFPSYITNVNVGYFLGNPIRYTSMNEQFIQELQDIFIENDEQDENIVLARFASIAGTAFEIVYLDEDGAIRFNEVSPEQMVMVYDDKITPKPLYAVRGWEKGTTQHLEVYTKDEVIKYTDGKEVDRYYHFIGDVPVVEYPNNDDKIGDFEKVLSLIDAYDKAQSNIADDFEYFSDAILMLKNLSSTKAEDIEAMRKARAMLVDGDGDAKWLLKDVQDTAHENYKTRLQSDIHRFSQTPNLTDEAFAGNATGVALSYKLLGLEWNVAVKERKFKRAIQRRIELICNVLETKGKSYDWREVEIQFHRNLPQNELEAVQIVSLLKGIVSEDTLLGIVPYVDDPSNEKEKIEKEGFVELEVE